MKLRQVEIEELMEENICESEELFCCEKEVEKNTTFFETIKNDCIKLLEEMPFDLESRKNFTEVIKQCEDAEMLFWNYFFDLHCMEEYMKKLPNNVYERFLALEKQNATLLYC